MNVSGIFIDLLTPIIEVLVEKSYGVRCFELIRFCRFYIDYILS